jgi:phospholipase C
LTPEIEHVVVLMLENRSFDHMLGYLDQGFIGPVSDSDGVPHDPRVPGSEIVHVAWLDSYLDVTVDPGHGYEDVMRQLSGTCGPWTAPYTLPNDGFVWNYGVGRAEPNQQPTEDREIMDCYKADGVPVMSTLAREFAVCTRWHCSLPSETWPNRLFVHAGTSFGETEFEALSPVHLEPTIFDLVDRDEPQSRIYAGDVTQTLAFGPGMLDRISFMHSFEGHVRSGRLPRYTFIEPRHADTWLFGKCNSQHPTSEFLGVRGTGYVPRGEALLARVYTTLRSSKFWKKTLLIVTYDEHGGFFDRVRPPCVPETGDVAENGFRFDLLGPRVPALAISPYIPSGTVEHDRTFEHTSVPATVRAAFGIDSPLSEREAQAETLIPLLTLEKPRDDTQTPDLSRYANEDWFPPDVADMEAHRARPPDHFQKQLLVLMDEIDSMRGFEVTAAAETIETVADAGRRIEEFVQRHYRDELPGPTAAAT